MSRLRAVLGYGWAALMVPVVLATFFGFDSWSRGLAKSTGVKVSPWYTGGAVARTLTREGYTVAIHEPVFDALIGERAVGFVQVRLQPTAGELPAALEERLDLDGDGADDAVLHLEGRAAQVEALSSRIAGQPEVIDLGKAKVVRVPMRNVERR